MLEITEKDILARMQFDNPWWSTRAIEPDIQLMPHRDYFPGFYSLVRRSEVRRAVVLMGPRRIGKTVLLKQVIQALIGTGVKPEAIFYVSLDTPVYSRRSLERLYRLFVANFSTDKIRRHYVIFDEIQYLRDWEVHLKSLVDSYKSANFVASGSAAAALRLKSTESGAGRFTDFILPPLTFAEFLRFSRKDKEVMHPEPDGLFYKAKNITELNEEFLRYLNFGGYPELVFSKEAQEHAERYVRSDIIDKVLLRDLPSLYGISDIQELNSLFTTLAYNTGQEMSLESLAQSSNVAKNTLKRYIEYLEAAFLVRRIERVDRNARRFQRAVTFKTYLTNPALRAALFGQITADDEHMGSVAESAVFAQWFHDVELVRHIKYARWEGGEVDIVSINPGTQSPQWVVEVKWSDRYLDHPSELLALIDFVTRHPSISQPVLVTTRTKHGLLTFRGVQIEFRPASEYCYTVGKNIVESLNTSIPERDQLELGL